MITNDDILIPINNLKNAFINNPYYFLTEEDVRSFLVHEFYKRDNLSNPVLTEDNKNTIAIHSEIRWYKYANDQNKRTDVVIINPSDLRVTDLLEDLSSKEFGFNEYWAAIELKFRRNQNFKSNQSFLLSVKADLELLRQVRSNTKERMPDLNPVYYVICFDRGDDLTNQISLLRDEFTRDEIQLIYVNNR